MHKFWRCNTDTEQEDDTTTRKLNGACSHFLVLKPIVRAGIVHSIELPPKQDECFLTVWDWGWSFGTCYPQVCAWDLFGLDQSQTWDRASCVTVYIDQLAHCLYPNAD